MYLNAMRVREKKARDSLRAVGAAEYLSNSWVVLMVVVSGYTYPGLS